MKDLTGGDTLTGRLPYGTAAISFQPTHKRVVVDNHMPNIRDTSSGMWGRVGLVSFNVVVPLDQRDRHLLQKLKAEAQGRRLGRSVKNSFYLPALRCRSPAVTG